MVYTFFCKKSEGTGVTALANKSAFNNEQLAQELHKLIITKFKKRTVYSAFRDYIWGVHLAVMQSMSQLNKEFRFFWCVIDIFRNYGRVVPLKDKKKV